MSNIQKAVNSILNNNLIEGKKLIQSSLYEKMGKLLEQQLVEFAPSVFNEKMDPVGDEDEDVRIQSGLRSCVSVHDHNVAAQYSMIVADGGVTPESIKANINGLIDVLNQYYPAFREYVTSEDLPEDFESALVAIS